jgi:LemA protein
LKTRSAGFYILIAAAVLIVIGLIAGISTYNNMVGLSANIDEKQSNIESQLQRRADLIPNLVATVKGYAAHETDAIKAVTDARAKLAGASSTSGKLSADAELTGALNRLLVIVENYPTLKADANFRQLSDELAGTENRINYARTSYNEAVKEYNAKTRSFPSNIIAGMFGFGQKGYFQASKGAESAPEVNFGS